MTLLFIDGFDAQDAQIKYADTHASAPTFAVAPRYGAGSALTPPSVAGVYRKSFPAASRIYVGVAFHW